MECDCQISKLTDLFYDTYPNPPYSEILQKRQRAYNCLLFELHCEYFICIPFRTEIKHSYAYHFKKSKRSLKHKSGLDYTKTVIINKKEYIDNGTTLVDNDEFREMMINLEKIRREVLEFVKDYKEHMNGTKSLHPSEFKRRYTFSPLRYFHKELEIE